MCEWEYIINQVGSGFSLPLGTTRWDGRLSIESEWERALQRRVRSFGFLIFLISTVSCTTPADKLRVPEIQRLAPIPPHELERERLTIAEELADERVQQRTHQLALSEAGGGKCSVENEAHLRSFLEKSRAIVSATKDVRGCSAPIGETQCSVNCGWTERFALIGVARSRHAYVKNFQRKIFGQKGLLQLIVLSRSAPKVKLQVGNRERSGLQAPDADLLVEKMIGYATESSSEQSPMYLKGRYGWLGPGHGDVSISVSGLGCFLVFLLEHGVDSNCLGGYDLP